jgi:hypothetical protein
MAKRLRNEDFPDPKRIEDDDWEMICKTARIPTTEWPRLRQRLDDLIDAFATWMRNERMRPDRNSDRERIKKALSHIHRAVATMNRLGPAGHTAFRAISPLLSPMLAAQWIIESFPNDDWAPHRSSLPTESSGWREPPRTPIRAPKYLIEEHTLESRYKFVCHAPVQTTGAALKEIEKGVTNVLCSFDLQPKSKGGQKPLIFRHYMIINLIEMWDEIGRTPSSGPNSDCTSFCSSVVDAIGWPGEGLDSAMPDAIKHWRHFSGKNCQ